MKNKIIKDMEVSAIGFGCWAIGGEWNNVTDKKSIESINSAIDLGINFFDVAPIYGKGHAETVLGRSLKNKNRSDIIIATKCGLLWDENVSESLPVNNLSPDSIYKEIENSLRRLQTDYIDIYQLHWPDPKVPIEETALALLDLKKQGKIRHVGVSNFSLEMTKEMQSYLDVATFQGLYNLLEQNPTQYHSIPLDYRTRDEALPFCHEYDIKFLPYSPLMQGLLTGKLKNDNNWDDSDARSANPKLNGMAFEPYYNCVEELKVLATKWNIPLSHLALHWLVSQNDIGPVLAGAYTPLQVQDNASFMESDCSKDILQEAESIVSKWNLQ